MRFAQLLRGVSPPVPPVEVGRVHFVDSGKSIPKELSDGRAKLGQKQLEETYAAILSAMEQGAQTYAEIAEKADRSLTAVKHRMPDLEVREKVKRLPQKRHQPLRFVLA